MRHSAPPDLTCLIAGVRLATPLVLASGIWGTSPTLLERAARLGAGAVTAKTCTPVPVPATAIPRRSTGATG